MTPRRSGRGFFQGRERTPAIVRCFTFDLGCGLFGIRQIGRRVLLDTGQLWLRPTFAVCVVPHRPCSNAGGASRLHYERLT